MDGDEHIGIGALGQGYAGPEIDGACPSVRVMSTRAPADFEQPPELERNGEVGLGLAQAGGTGRAARRMPGSTAMSRPESGLPASIAGGRRTSNRRSLPSHRVAVSPDRTRQARA